MKQNPLLVAVLALAVLGGFVYYTTEHPPEAETDTVPLVKLDEKSINKVTIVKPGGETIEVHRTGEEPWAFGGGVTVAADDSAIDLMITNLASLDASRVVQEQTTDWTPYGLEGDGLLRVTVEAAEAQPKTIIFGEDTPTGSAIFARIDGDSRLFTTYSYVRENFDKTVFDWRNKRFLRVQPETISSLSLQVGTRHFEFAKNDQSWRMMQPAELRADRLTVNDLERELTNAQMSSVLAEGDEAAANAYSFAKPYAVAEITDATGAHVLTIAEGGPSGYVVKSSDLPGGVYEAPAELAESLNKELNDYRDANLFDFGFRELSRIDIRDGAQRTTLEEEGGKWLLRTDGNREAEEDKVRSLVSAIRALNASGYPSDDAAAQSRYGLETPVMELEATTSLGLRPVEKVLVSDPAAARVYAARANEPSTYELEKTGIERIREALNEVLTPAEPEEPAGE